MTTIRHATSLHRAGMASYSTNKVLPMSLSFTIFPFHDQWPGGGNLNRTQKNSLKEHSEQQAQMSTIIK